jgi:hypothetical protein
METNERQKICELIEKITNPKEDIDYLNKTQLHVRNSLVLFSFNVKHFHLLTLK